MNRQYEDMMRHVYERGVEKTDRTGTGTRSVFAPQMRFDLAKGFPLITTKKVSFKLVVAELLWILSGSTNVKDLQARGCHIWDEWAGEDGSLGPIYGEQWRSWPAAKGDIPFDQIADTVRLLRDSPDSRRIVVSAWNVSDLSAMALSPCHALFQFYTSPMSAAERVEYYEAKSGADFTAVGADIDDVHDCLDDLSVPRLKLSCQLYQRSADVFLGVPFNIASYSLLTMMLAEQCSMAPGEFVWTGGDTHIYTNHFAQVEEQLSRPVLPFPRVSIRPQVEDIFSYTPDDFMLIGYEHAPAIKGDVAV